MLRNLRYTSNGCLCYLIMAGGKPEIGCHLHLELAAQSFSTGVGCLTKSHKVCTSNGTLAIEQALLGFTRNECLPILQEQLPAGQSVTAIKEISRRYFSTQKFRFLHIRLDFKSCKSSKKFCSLHLPSRTPVADVSVNVTETGRDGVTCSESLGSPVMVLRQDPPLLTPSLSP